MRDNFEVGKERETFSLLSNRKRIAAVTAVLFVIVAIITFILSSKYTLPAYSLVNSDIWISEYMTTNTRYFDEYGQSCDFIEVYNGTNKTANLKGCVLKKDDKTYIFPSTTLKSGECTVVWLNNGEGETHAKFKLTSKGGDEIILKNQFGDTIDELITKAHEKNYSVIRSNDKNGNKTDKISVTPTPGFPNTEEGRKNYLKSRYIENETGIILNEIMASNDTVIEDEFGKYPDYVELYNTTNKSVDISGFGLTDEEDNPFKWRIPQDTKLKKDEYLLLFLSSDYKIVDEKGNVEYVESNQGQLLVPFGIKSSGESLLLSDGSARYIDRADIASPGSDNAMIRQENGEWTITTEPSPGYPNTEEGARMSMNNHKQTVSMDDIIISEASSRNTESAAVDGSCYDWVEIYNPTDKAISLKGYTLTDKSSVPGKYTLPDTELAAKSYLLVYSTSDDLGDNLNTGFALNGSCKIHLFSPSGKRLDYVSLTELLCNVSKGRETGSTEWVYFTEPTPGSENGKGVEKITPRPTASVPSGQYNNTDGLEVSLSGSGTIYYTLDGSKPTTSSKVYKEPFRFTETSVLRAICKDENSIASSVSSYSYIINENHKMDVVSVVSDPDGLFSGERGIYITGSRGGSSFPYEGSNIWQGWKRECNLSLLPLSGEETGFSIDCETSIFGGMTRAYDKRSLKFRFKDIYGSGKLHYKLFKNRDFDEYESLVIRAGGQDAFGAMMKDDVTTSLADCVVDVMASRPVVMYINGQYWGIFYIREKISADFIASHYNVSPESVDMCSGNGRQAEYGSNEDWLALKQYVQSHDMSTAESYKYVCDRVDVKNYADYIIAEMYCANNDQGNIRYFKSSDYDNKWRWIMYDTDLGFQSDIKAPVWDLINPAGTGANDYTSTFLINGLMKNSEFRKLFIERLEYQMDNVWNTERVLAKIDEYEAAIKDEVPRNKERWEKSAYSWESRVESMRYFAQNRASNMKDEFKNDSRVRNIIALSSEELDRCFKEAKN